MSQFPQELVLPMIASALTMLALAWLIFHRATERASQSFVIGFVLLLWFVLAFLLARSQGFFFRLSLPPLPNIGLLFLPIVVGLHLVTRSIAFQHIIDHVSEPLLTGIQFMRVMGAAFLLLYARGLMPAAFAFPAGIGDIIVGTTAPIVALLLFYKTPWSRLIAIVWNVVGFLELCVAIVLGFLTSPTPYQLLSFDTPNALLFDFPLVLVPVFAVPLSLILHLCSLRLLFAPRLRQ